MNKTCEHLRHTRPVGGSRGFARTPLLAYNHCLALPFEVVYYGHLIVSFVATLRLCFCPKMASEHAPQTPLVLHDYACKHFQHPCNLPSGNLGYRPAHFPITPNYHILHFSTSTDTLHMLCMNFKFKIQNINDAHPSYKIIFIRPPRVVIYTLPHHYIITSLQSLHHYIITIITSLIITSSHHYIITSLIITSLHHYIITSLPLQHCRETREYSTQEERGSRV